MAVLARQSLERLAFLAAAGHRWFHRGFLCGKSQNTAMSAARRPLALVIEVDGPIHPQRKNTRTSNRKRKPKKSHF
jgi:hypothetical protein